ncbi:MAG TPA: NAD(P)/FAD-dependent oxidoreductase [Gammaproteobacteria bacterium]|nr:NAD(P)/FAD-dependent oxidoreductase [Gammaproteobacteria bacterium]
MTSQSRTIIVLGGGIGGIVTATLLRKQLPPEHRVVLIEREARHVFAPSFPWVMAGLRRPRKISRSRTRLSRLGVELIQGDIEKIDAEQRSVQVNGQQITGDYLVIALGAEMAAETIPGLSEAGHTFYTLQGAEALNEARRKFEAGRIAVLVSSVPFKCPAAPVEAAMLLDGDCRKRNIREIVKIDIYTPEPGPMALAGPENSRMLRSMVEAKGIVYHPEHAVTRVDPERQRLYFANGATANFDLLVYVPPHRAPQVVLDAGLTGESGWIPVDKYTLATKFARVYAIGDVTGIKLSVGKPLPKAGVIAHGQAEVVAHNIIHELTGKGVPGKFNGHGACFIETGGGRAGFGQGNFYAEPAPRMKFYRPGYLMHLGKVAYEKYWLFKWF